jgi:signal transduction histidine kinase
LIGAASALVTWPHSAFAGGGPLARAVGQLRELAAGALAEMRALIFELRPEALTEEGLVAALARQAAAVSAREQLPVTVQGPSGPLPLPAGTAEHCYRVALEALNNAVKHAAASRVSITVEADGEHVLVSVTDDGAGFDPGLARPGPPGPARHGRAGRGRRRRPGAGQRARHGHPGAAHRARPPAGGNSR